MYSSDGYLIAEARVVMDGKNFSEEEIPAQIVLLETQYAGGRLGKKVVYEEKLIFDAQTGKLLWKESLDGKIMIRRYLLRGAISFLALT
ncbi:hypothetical protein Noc_0974 [Nitrosococcus oceani ATCC 19707]|uniref:Uncharacterized protein n=2 Tax=Nitrosococcus oceani TaxID=1229 RepID=Q3JCG2_NITOC|nr:hypothetical protein Noc_0974 [Nitrosococcus oceani ATCC 19707]EDZ66939.1 hypothetical protein NOC27_266 [Nitrosococcus oceani AFC27]KFI19982.1 hypothetical protein IB75_04990 [Nitrosococcus oceani C-27]KFI23239.1 hypothetical protein HW44_04860 [Nitrosococcus oceani]